MSDILEAERGIIGILLTDNAAIVEVDVSHTEFENRQCARIYHTIRTMMSRCEVVDVITLSDELARISDQDWLPLLAGMAAEVVTTKHARGYSDAIRRKFRERSAIEIATNLAEEVKTQGLAAVDRALTGLMGLSTEQRQTVTTLKEALKGAIGVIEATLARGGIPGLSTGYTDLDKILGGYHKTDLIVVGARPAMGKTAWMMNQILRHDVPVGVFSTEQAAVQLALRAISIEGRVDSTSIRTAELDDQQYANMNRAIAELSGKKIVFDERAQPTIADLQRQARRWRHEIGIEAIHLDYIQRIKATDTRAPKHERVEEVVVGLKSLAKELEIPVIALAQVNRQVDTRPDKRPHMGDLSDSSAIEKEADVVYMLYRDDVYNKDSEHPGTAEINIEKNRHGPTGKMVLSFLGNYLRFEQISNFYRD